ncbi:MAG: DUF4261 domain-containing protein [Clostridiaceae bacterium]
MGLIDKFLGRKENKNDLNQNKDENEGKDLNLENGPALIMVFDTLPIIDGKNLSKRIEKIEKLNTEVEVTIEKELNNGETLLSVIEFDDHKIKLVGFNAPLPDDVINYTVDCSYWKPEDKDNIRNHKAHIICYYDGQNLDPSEKYIALYKVIYGFREKGLVGIINEGAWTCQPAYVVEDLVGKEMLMASREVPPLMLWTNFIKMPMDYGTWMFTKGNHIFGVNDFAYLGDINEAAEINEIFNNIFYYIYENQAIVESGHTLQIEEEVYLKFRDVYRENEYLESPLGTLVIEKINQNEINAPR